MTAPQRQAARPTLYASEGYAGSTVLFDKPDRRSTSHVMTVFRRLAEGEVYDGFRVTWADRARVLLGPKARAA